MALKSNILPKRDLNFIFQNFVKKRHFKNYRKIDKHRTHSML